MDRLSDEIIFLTGAVKLTRMMLEERRMARDYMNLPGLLDTLEDEMDIEAEDVIRKAREAQERGLAAMGRVRKATVEKHAVLERLEKFADNMEARNTSNMPPPDQKIRPTNGAGSSATSEGSSEPVSSRPSETAQLHDVKGV
jgi:hypothetical protein